MIEYDCDGYPSENGEMISNVGLSLRKDNFWCLKNYPDSYVVVRLAPNTTIDLNGTEIKLKNSCTLNFPQYMMSYTDIAFSPKPLSVAYYVLDNNPRIRYLNNRYSWINLKLPEGYTTKVILG